MYLKSVYIFKCHTFRNPFYSVSEVLCERCSYTTMVPHIRLAYMVDHLSVSVRCCFYSIASAAVVVAAAAGFVVFVFCRFVFFLPSIYTLFLPLLLLLFLFFCMICFNKYFISSAVCSLKNIYGLRFHSPFCLCVLFAYSFFTCALSLSFALCMFFSSSLTLLLN